MVTIHWVENNDDKLTMLVPSVLWHHLLDRRRINTSASKPLGMVVHVSGWDIAWSTLGNLTCLLI